MSESPTKDHGTAMYSRPLRADAARNRNRIIDAADKLLARHGSSVTLDDVAAEAGVGIGTVYRHFNNKQDLAIEILSDYFIRIGDIVRDCARDPDPWLGLVQMLEYTCELIAGNRAFIGALTGCDSNSMDFDLYQGSVNAALDNLLGRARVGGAVRQEITVVDIWSAISMVQGVAAFTHQVAPDNWRRYLALILNGMRGESTRALAIPSPPLTSAQIKQARTTVAQLRRR
ncbi:TetR/AcrR family transcriptional regulator [Nocardia sp. NPDC059240]|uniref:TetR/AcrR family transcriptional regulator n=1 Tax=Nocardia sp. NPDC059240 TaxID=3346786 RepID=UPI0036957AA9